MTSVPDQTTVGRAHAGMPVEWREIPMPPGVARLPRTNGGIPITYTVAWSSETEPELREDPLLRPLLGPGVPALFHSGRPGEGSPKLAVSDVARQRRVNIEGLCQACGQKLPGRARPPWRQHPRWLADLRNFGQTIQMGLRTVPLIVDGWTCAPCLAYALKVCPGLVAKRAGHGDELRLLRVRDARLIATWEHLPKLAAEAVGWVKIAPTAFEFVTPDEFMAETARANRKVVRA